MFPFLPGVHFDTANVRNLLLASGVEASEAMCLGIGGGIAAGYQFCPSVQNDPSEASSGLQFIPRVKMYTTNGAWYRDTFARLGVEMDIRESTGKRAALTNLMAGLEAGKPVVAWTAPLGLEHTLHWTVSCGMYTVLVHEVAGDTVRYSDHVSVREMSLPAFTAARDRVCSLKNRTMTVSMGKKLNWKVAVREGLRETVADFARPRLGTFNLPGLKEGVGLINGRGKRSWPVQFPGAMMILPMRDLFESIELGTGGGLMRPLYAKFLEEAAVLLGRKELGRVAESYRKLGLRWTAFADFLLPESFTETKRVMRAFAAGDPLQANRLHELRKVPLSWDETQATAFREEAAGRLKALYERELAVSQELSEAVGKI